ncbi:nitrate ABC transporter substrate-binding protein [Geobacter pickeringii]|uniref:Nitrate ABC transporter substrate-binding protein n=1 Tax=Geobacter pickeringii TaxID=345632 RepID=A0A0B5BL25_9BACT|nr:nitrate ABC transporter substrate-binding protein [Geobacter pickeringii]
MRLVATLVAAVLALTAGAFPAAAEVRELRIAKQYGLGYLPLIVIEEQRLIEKHARAAGLGDVKVTWATLGGGSATNDALLSGSVDFIASGVAPLIVLWSKTGGNVKGFAALDTSPLYLNTNNSAVKSIRDFTDKDRIALPAVKVSIQAIVLQMAAAKAFGPQNFDRLDRFTVSMKHPDAMAALLSGKSEITAHLTSPPFMFQELDDKRVRTVLNSYDVLGGPHTFNVIATTKAFYEKNPKLAGAVLAALEEADEYIRKNRKAAAELYVKASGTKESLTDVLSQLNNPALGYSTTPVNVARFANFMHQTGTIKTKPRDWKDLFFTTVHGRKGS